MLWQNLIPGWSSLKAIAAGAFSVALVAGGVAFGVWAHALGDGRRVAEAVKPMCDAAAAKARVAALEKAVAEERAAREERDRANEQLGLQLSRAEADKKELRDATLNADRVCVPADAPWVRQAR